MLNIRYHSAHSCFVRQEYARICQGFCPKAKFLRSKTLQRQCVSYACIILLLRPFSASVEATLVSSYYFIIYLRAINVNSNSKSHLLTISLSSLVQQKLYSTLTYMQSIKHAMNNTSNNILGYITVRMVYG